MSAQFVRPSRAARECRTLPIDLAAWCNQYGFEPWLRDEHPLARLRLALFAPLFGIVSGCIIASVRDRPYLAQFGRWYYVVEGRGSGLVAYWLFRFGKPKCPRPWWLLHKPSRPYAASAGELAVRGSSEASAFRFSGGCNVQTCQ